MRGIFVACSIDPDGTIHEGVPDDRDEQEWAGDLL